MKLLAVNHDSAYDGVERQISDSIFKVVDLHALLKRSYTELSKSGMPIMLLHVSGTVFVKIEVLAVASIMQVLKGQEDIIVYLLLVYGTKTHEARNSDLVYLITRNPFTPLHRCEWTYVAAVHSLSHQAMMQASDQLHTTSFCSPPVLSYTRDTHNKQNVHCFCS